MAYGDPPVARLALAARTPGTARRARSIRPVAGGAGHALDGEVGRRLGNRVAGLLDRLDDRAGVVVRGEIEARPPGGEVDRDPLTPGRAPSTRSTRPVQEAQVMPSTGRVRRWADIGTAPGSAG